MSKLGIVLLTAGVSLLIGAAIAGLFIYIRFKRCKDGVMFFDGDRINIKFNGPIGAKLFKKFVIIEVDIPELVNEITDNDDSQEN